MSADESEKSKPSPVDAALARARAATEIVDPPLDFAARVMTATRGRHGSWTQLGAAGRFAVPIAAIAAAAALALAWVAEAPFDAETVDSTEEVP